MISQHFRRHGAAILVPCVIAIAAQACGGGGANQTGASGSPNTQPGQVTGTPRPTATPSETLLVLAGESISAAVRGAPAGALIVVAPGNYGPLVLGPGDLHGPISLLADVTGHLSGSPPAEVTIVANRGERAAIDLLDLTAVTIDGFTARGGAEAGVLVSGGSGITVQNCTVTGSVADGLRIDQAERGMVFDNVIWNNRGAGVRLLDTSRMQIINNTVYGNDGGGLLVGDAEAPAVDTTATNNIFDANTPAGIVVDESATGYRGDYNLTTDGYGDATPIGAHDINNGAAADPLFVFPGGGNFRLQKGLAGSVSPAIDAGDPGTNASLVTLLRGRTTQSDGSPDEGRVDLGYHYPIVVATIPILR
jgi:parallel beta-helix repeat protein